MKLSVTGRATASVVVGALLPALVAVLFASSPADAATPSAVSAAQLHAAAVHQSASALPPARPAHLARVPAKPAQELDHAAQFYAQRDGLFAPAVPQKSVPAASVYRAAATARAPPVG